MLSVRGQRITRIHAPAALALHRLIDRLSHRLHHRRHRCSAHTHRRSQLNNIIYIVITTYYYYTNFKLYIHPNTRHTKVTYANINYLLISIFCFNIILCIVIASKYDTVHSAFFQSSIIRFFCSHRLSSQYHKHSVIIGK